MKIHINSNEFSLLETTLISPKSHTLKWIRSPMESDFEMTMNVNTTSSYQNIVYLGFSSKLHRILQDK